MKKWVESTLCRRELILQYFDETLSGKIPFCCDQCGLKLNDYQTGQQTLTLKENEQLWKDYLAKILTNRELSK